MYQIFEPIRKSTYEKLIELLITKSDSFIFHLPNYGKIYVNERNKELMSEYPIGYSEEESQEEYETYVREMDKYIDIVREDIIERYTDTGYLDQAFGYEIEIYHMAISDKTMKLLKQTDDLSKWLYPELPENPCFLRDGKCVFECIAHEYLYFIYVEDEEIEDFLRKNKIEYVYMEYEAPNYDTMRN